MEELFAGLEAAYADYARELEAGEKKQRVTDGLFGFGHSLKDDACHDRLDERLERTVKEIRDAGPTPMEAERAVKLLLMPREKDFPQQSARWMLRAAERHALELIPFLDVPAAEKMLEEYSSRYRPWDRLPSQKQIIVALKRAARIGKKELLHK